MQSKLQYWGKRFFFLRKIYQSVTHLLLILDFFSQQVEWEQLVLQNPTDFLIFVLLLDGNEIWY